MSNINRDYLIVLNPKTSKVTVPELNYYIYDKYTANLFVNLVTVENGKIVNMADADQYKLVLHVLKPTNEIQTVEDIQVFNKEKALFQIELDQELTKNIGRYKCELLTIDKTDHIVQSAKFSYRVKKSIYNDLDVVTETPQYPIIITLLDKLQDIDKYEEERRANEVARVAAEKARVKDYTDLRQTVTTDIDTMQEKIDSFDGKVQEVDNAVQQMRTNITNYQTEKNKELDSYKTQKDTQINTSIKNMETTIDTYKTEKDKQINDKISQQDTKIDNAIDLQNKNIQASTKALNDKLDAAVQDQNDTIAANNQAQNKVISDAVAAQNKTINTVVESDKVQNDRLDTLETNDTNNKAEIKKLQDKDVEHEERMTAIEAVNVEQNNRLDAIEIKNDQQDSRLNDVEAKNKKQDLDLKCLFAESHSERITLEDEVGNSVFLQNSKQGFATVDELKGNTLVNCNKDTDKELILNGNIDTSGYGTVTTTEGVDGGLVDVGLEGNTMVNVCDQEDPIAITKSYEVTTGNHVALQGEYDGKCRPVLNGNTLVNLIDKFNESISPQGAYTTTNKGFTLTKEHDGGISYFVYKLKYALDKSKKYTIIYDIVENTLVNTDTDYGIYADGAYGAIGSTSTTGGSADGKLGRIISVHNVKTTDDNLDCLSIGIHQGDTGGKLVIDNLMLLEGDYTNKPIPNYFTGLQSSFEDGYIPENLASNVINNGVINKQYSTLSTVNVSKLKRNTKYTTFIKNNSDENISVYSNNKTGNFNWSNIVIPAKSSTVAIITTKDEELDVTQNIWLSLYVTETLPQNISVYLVEGDYTNYDFTNYDSSKGGKYKVDYKVTGKNLFDINDNYINNSNLDVKIIDNSITISKPTIGYSRIDYFIPIHYELPNSINLNYKIVDSNAKYFVYLGICDEGMKELVFKSSVQSQSPVIMAKDRLEPVKNKARYYKISFEPAFVSTDDIIGNEFVTIRDIQLEEGDTATTYEPYKEYTKTFYLNSPLLEGDTIEDVNGKATHVHRYKSVTFDGSDDENWAIKQDDWELPNSIVFATVFPNGKGYIWNTYTGEESVSDKIPSYGDDYLRTNDIFGYTNDNISANKYFRIPKSYLSTQDVAGFRKYLQQNPATVVYELATPTYETISNDSILCDSYVNGHLDVDSVIPIERVNFKPSWIYCKYVYTNTEYTIQFEADNVGTLNLHFSGGDKNNNSIIKGINKINITTTNDTAYLQFSGIGFNMSNIVVTPKVEQPFGYFKGMKSVGQDDENGNKIEILSQNKNLCSINSYIGVKYNKIETNIKCKKNTIYTLSFNDLSDLEGNKGITLITHKTPTDASSHEAIYIHAMNEGGKEYVFRSSGFTFNTSDCNYISLTSNNNRGIDNINVQEIQIEEGSQTSYSPHTFNTKEILLNEPLRGLPNGVKDKIVIIDGKWYIERNCMVVQFKDLKYSRTDTYQKAEFPDVIGFRLSNTGIQPPIMCDRFAYTNDRIINFGELLTNKEAINITSSNTTDEFFITIQKAKLTTLDFNGLMKYFTDNPMEIIAKATTPTYEPIEYNPFEVYSATTHISNNSNIPCNMVIRNSGFNCILKPNTTYTVSSNNGLSSVVTKASIGDSVLRFYDKDTTSVTKMSNVLVLEGDYITGNPPIPAFFKDMESTFEQELVTDEQDKNYGKYKVNVKATNPDNKQENNITFYIKEPLRGVGNVKDKVYVKEDKVVVERNCAGVTLDGSENKKISLNAIRGNLVEFIITDNLIPNRVGVKYVATTLPNIDGVVEKVVCGYRSIYIQLHKTKLQSIDVPGFRQWLQANPVTVVYELATPTYEEVEYFDLKLFVEIFKDTTIIYNSNIPVTSTINYTYSTPLTDAVNTVSDISDQQDSMIIDMATQVATMEMMLM